MDLSIAILRVFDAITLAGLWLVIPWLSNLYLGIWLIIAIVTGRSLRKQPRFPQHNF